MNTEREIKNAIVKAQLPRYLAGRGIDVRRAFRCLNPKHDDKHPSMSYDRQHNRCNCFACRARYDIFDVIAVCEGLDKGGAFKRAYEYAGEALPAIDGAKPMERNAGGSDWKAATRRGATQGAKDAPMEVQQKKEELTPSQKQALLTIEKGGWFFLTGPGGTGKSHLVKELIRRARLRGERVMVCASTGIAAQHIGGATVHRAFSVFDKKTKSSVIFPGQCLLAAGATPLLMKTDFVVIDEISMLRFDVCEYVLAQISRAWEVAKGKKTVLFVGDFWQLPPVMQTRDRKMLAATWGEEYVLKGGFAFLAPTWQKQDVQMIELKEITRQSDPAFSNALNLVRRGDYAGVEWIQSHCAKQFQVGGVGIYPTNKQVLKQNTPMLDNIDGRVYSYEAKLEGDAKPSDILGEEVFEFKIGASVIALANEAGGEGYCNGSVGVIRKVCEGEIDVYFGKVGLRTVKPLKRMVYSYNSDGEEVEVGSATQYPLRLSWAITVHKAQGQTYNAVNLSPSSFEAGQLYVALSRVKSVERLYLVNPIFPTDLKINKTVKTFYDNVLDVKPTEVKPMFKVLKPPKRVSVVGAPPVPTFSALESREEMYD